MKLKDITLPVALLGCVTIPAVCALIYLLVSKLVESGENLGGIVVAVVTILGAMGVSSARTRSKLEQVEKQTNGNLTRVELQRDGAYQQALHLAVQALPGTVVPSFPVLPPPAVPPVDTVEQPATQPRA